MSHELLEVCRFRRAPDSPGILFGRSKIWWIKLLIIPCAIIGLVSGCGHDATGTAPSGTSKTYFALVLNQHAINMSLVAPANTMRLSATAFDMNNDTLSDISQVTYRATDSSVSVSDSGVVTAHFTTSSNGSIIIATMQKYGVTHADSAYVYVTATTPPALDIFSIQPAPGDSAIRAITSYTPTVTAKSGANDVVFGGLGSGNNIIWLTSSDSKVAVTNRGGAGFVFSFVDTGHVTLYASTWYYGVPLRDSLPFLATWSLRGSYIILPDGSPLSFAQGIRFLGVGGSVDWLYNGTDSLDIVFDDSADVSGADTYDEPFFGISGGGNIHLVPNPLYGFDLQARGFPKVGEYHYHNRADPTAQATIYVLTNPK